MTPILNYAAPMEQQQSTIPPRTDSTHYMSQCRLHATNGRYLPPFPNPSRMEDDNGHNEQGCQRPRRPHLGWNYEHSTTGRGRETRLGSCRSSSAPARVPWSPPPVMRPADTASTRRPVIIGTGPRSVVSAASYEARRYGINSAMASARARQLCPDGVFLPVDMRYYRMMSHRIFSEVFSQITDRIEQVSVDECYMDVSGALLRWGSPSAIGAWIRRQVAARYHVTCSVGIARTSWWPRWPPPTPSRTACC